MHAYKYRMPLISLMHLSIYKATNILNLQVINVVERQL